jgi:tRNA-dihydrouridine synthase
VIEQGDYLFTLQNFINKKFIIGNGGTISWNGDPYEAKIDIDAIYSVQRTTISELMQSNGSVLNTQDLNEANQKIPVDVYMNLSGSLMQPNIGFDIRIPSGFSSMPVSLVVE